MAQIAESTQLGNITRKGASSIRHRLGPAGGCSGVGGNGRVVGDGSMFYVDVGSGART